MWKLVLMEEKDGLGEGVFRILGHISWSSCLNDHSAKRLLEKNENRGQEESIQQIRIHSVHLTGDGPPPEFPTNSIVTILAVLGNLIEPFENSADPPSLLRSITEANFGLNTYL